MDVDKKALDKALRWMELGKFELDIAERNKGLSWEVGKPLKDYSLAKNYSRILKVKYDSARTKWEAF